MDRVAPFSQTLFCSAALAVLLSSAAFAQQSSLEPLPATPLFSELDQAPLSCLLEPSVEVELSSEVQGVVKSLSLKRGDTVQEGQVVMTLRSDVENAALNTVKARLEYATRKVERNAELYSKKLISDTEQDEMLTEQRLAAFQLREARVRLEQRETKSPISGVVIERLKNPGEFVDETPFLRIATLNPLHAEVVLPAQWYGKVSKEQAVIISAMGQGEPHNGVIKVIDPVIDAASNTFAVTVAIDNADGQLAAGVRCDALLEPRK